MSIYISCLFLCVKAFSTTLSPFILHHVISFTFYASLTILSHSIFLQSLNLHCSFTPFHSVLSPTFSHSTHIIIFVSTCVPAFLHLFIHYIYFSSFILVSFSYSASISYSSSLLHSHSYPFLPFSDPFHPTSSLPFPFTSLSLLSLPYSFPSIFLPIPIHPLSSHPLPIISLP